MCGPLRTLIGPWSCFALGPFLVPNFLIFNLYFNIINANIYDIEIQTFKTDFSIQYNHLNCVYVGYLKWLFSIRKAVYK